MIKRIIICLIAGCLILGGCHRYSNDPPAHRIVKQIIITCQSGQETIQRHYDTPENLRHVLGYIRNVSGSFRAPADLAADADMTIHITTILNDDTQKVYRQWNNQWFRAGNGSWLQIDPDVGASFWEWIRQHPSD